MNSKVPIKGYAPLLVLTILLACGNEKNTLPNIKAAAPHPSYVTPEQQPAERNGGDQQRVETPVPKATPGGQAQVDPCTSNPLPKKQILNIQYQSTTHVDPNLQSLDLYMPAIGNTCTGVPIVIWVHGGAWFLGDKSQVELKAQHFTSLGYGFVSVNYRLSPQPSQTSISNPERIKFPDHPNDVGAAVAWVHKNIKAHGGNPSQLAILGHSAGAHLAALVALDQRYVEKYDSTWNSKSLRCLGSYDTEGYDIKTVIESAEGQQLLFYRNAFGDDPALWEPASPIKFVKEYGMSVQLAKRGDLERQSQLNNFKRELEAKKNTVDVIDAQTLTHAEVNRVIGAADDTVMTPSVTQFIKTRCFSP